MQYRSALHPCVDTPDQLTYMSQAISVTMVAYATFDRHDAALIQAVSAKVLHLPSAFDPQAVANTLWALALLEDLSPLVWNCLLVSFVQAERFNSKPIVSCRCIDEASCVSHQQMLVMQVGSQADYVATLQCYY